MLAVSCRYGFADGGFGNGSRSIHDLMSMQSTFRGIYIPRAGGCRRKSPIMLDGQRNWTIGGELSSVFLSTAGSFVWCLRDGLCNIKENELISAVDSRNNHLLRGSLQRGEGGTDSCEWW